MSNRSADATILGYRYQFDYSIKKILEQTDNLSEIELEGLEDIDILTQDITHLHQCKYYSGTEYNPSVIKQAITSMFNHFQANKDGNFRYYLYGHFKNGADKFSNDIEYLKNRLLDTSLIDEDEIKDFHFRLNINVNADEFTQQEESIIELLTGHFPRYENTEFIKSVYLANSRNIIIEKCSNRNNRKITKKQFLEQLISSETIIRNNILLINNNNYIALIKKNIKNLLKLSGTSNKNPATRFIILDINDRELDAFGISIFNNLLMKLHSKFSSTKCTRETEYFYPYFIFVNLTPEKIIELKQDLYLNNKFVIDGILFNGMQDEDRAKNLTDERFNNDNFRPFRILTSIEDIRKICDRIQQTDIKLKKIQLLDFYRNKINIESSNYQNVSTFYFQQSSIDMLQEIIND